MADGRLRSGVPLRTVETSSSPRRPRPRLPISDPDELLAALQLLEERDREVLEMRYGLGGTRPHNLREMAKVLGISRERVRQLEARAIERLGARHASPQSGTGSLAPATSRNALVRRWALALLVLRPGHVYELRKRLIEVGIPPPSYRDLYELEAEELVESTWVEARGAGPNRRVYSVTGKGRTQLESDRDVLEKTAEMLTEFLARGPDADTLWRDERVG